MEGVAQLPSGLRRCSGETIPACLDSFKKNFDLIHFLFRNNNIQNKQTSFENLRVEILGICIFETN